MADTKGGSFFGSVEEYVAARGGNRVIKKILVANNGIGAVKAIRSMRRWSYETFGKERTVQFVVMATPEDLRANAEYIRMADEVVDVPGGNNSNNYANVMLIVDIAERWRVDAVWAGWGHASENPLLPDTLATTARNIVFIGPSGPPMRALGDKIGSTIIAQSAGVPTIAWNGDGLKADYADGGIPDEVYAEADVTTAAQAAEECERIGFPVMIKASEGGGGKGIRKVMEAEGVAAAYRQVASEVPGSPIFVMRLAPRSRHLEVQLLADTYGQAIALNGRDCSVQRRHQKIIEEGPPVVASPEVWRDMERSAVELAKKVGYCNAGTVEYLYSMDDHKFFFLELNPRLQVEHPVTEMITKVNLPASQLQVAMGLPLHMIPDIRKMYAREPLGTDKIDFDNEERPAAQGHCIAVRITAENPDQGFQPTSGTIKELNFRSTPDVWGYFSVDSSGLVHEFADSQFGHLFARGGDREAARRHMTGALKELSIRGDIRTTVEYIGEVLQSDDFISNRIDTGWLDVRIAAAKDGSLLATRTQKVDSHLAVVTGAVVLAHEDVHKRRDTFVEMVGKGLLPPKTLLATSKPFDLIYEGVKYCLNVSLAGPREFTVSTRTEAGTAGGGGNSLVEAQCRPLADGGYLLIIAGKSQVVYANQEASGLRLSVNGNTCVFTKEYDPTCLDTDVAGKLARRLVSDGARVKEGEAYCEVEVMKMYMPLCVQEAGVIRWHLSEGAGLKPGDRLATLELDDPSSVTRAEVFEGVLSPTTEDSPRQGSSAAAAAAAAAAALANGNGDLVGEDKPHVVLRAALDTLGVVLNGYEVPEMVYLRAIARMRTSLWDELLPYHEVKEVLFALSGRLEADLARQLHSMANQYKRDCEAGVGDIVSLGFPAGHALSMLEARANGKADDRERAAFWTIVTDLSKVLRQHVQGPAGRAYAALLQLMRDYLDVERSFAGVDLEDALRALRKTHEGEAAGAVYDAFRSHASIARKNRLLLTLLDHIRQINREAKAFALAQKGGDANGSCPASSLTPAFGGASSVNEPTKVALVASSPSLADTDAFLPILSELSSLPNAAYSSVAARSRQLLIEYNSPSAEQRRALFVSAVKAVTAAAAEGDSHARQSAIDSFVARGVPVRDLLAPLLSTADVPTARAALELYAHRIYRTHVVDNLSWTEPVTTGLSSSAGLVHCGIFTFQSQSTEALPDYINHHGGSLNDLQRMAKDASRNGVGKGNSSGEWDIGSVPSGVSRWAGLAVVERLQDLDSGLESLLEAFPQFRGEAPSCSEGAVNALHVILLSNPIDEDTAPHSRQRLASAASEGAISAAAAAEAQAADDQTAAALREAMSKHIQALQKADVRRVTFLSPQDSSLDCPTMMGVFTFRARGGFEEDGLFRHIEPSHAFHLDLPRLANFDIRPANTSQLQGGNVHVYKATPKVQSGGAKGSKKAAIRYFARAASEAVGRGKRYFMEQMVLEALNGIDLALAEAEDARSRKAQEGTANHPGNNHIFVNAVAPDPEADPLHVEGHMRELMDRFQGKILRLGVKHLEVKIVCRPGKGRVLVPIRLVASNPTGYAVKVETYFEVSEGEKRVFRTMENRDQRGGGRGAGGRRSRTLSGMKQGWGGMKQGWDGQDVNTPYPVSAPFDDKREIAQARSDTLYCFDYLELLEAGVKEQWAAYAKDRPQVTTTPAMVLHSRELVVRRKQSRGETDIWSAADLEELEMVEVQRPAGLNDVGMVAWIITLRTPEYPEGRQAILIANDITYQAGSFGTREDMVFYLASRLAREKGLPRIYIAANSGARIGMAESLKKRFRVAWADPSDPTIGYSYLYLGREDYEEMKGRGAVVCQEIVDEASGETRYKILDVIGEEPDLGVENLQGSGRIAGETSTAFSEVFTLTLVVGRTVGIGAYLVRLGQRTIQKASAAPILLTGYQALNTLMGREVYTSNDQLGGVGVMGPNGVSHTLVDSHAGAVSSALRWLSYVPSSRGSYLPVLNMKGVDVVERSVDFQPPKGVPSDPRNMIAGHEDDVDGTWTSGFFDRGSFTETLAGWAETVVTGRARLGGIPVGIVATEGRLREKKSPADPADLTSHERLVQQAGGVWYPDSAHKTAQAIKDINHEGLPLMIFANWRGFSGGQRDMFDEVLKYGALIVDALVEYKQPVFVYIPPHSELRGGAWVVVDSTVNPNVMEMYAADGARGGVLEANGAASIKFRDKDLLQTAHRLDTVLKKLDLKLAACSDSDEKQHIMSSIGQREKKLIGVYRQVAVQFADLHDTPGRMEARGAIRKAVPWSESRSFFYWRLRRRLAEFDLRKQIRSADSSVDALSASAMLKDWFLSDRATDDRGWEEDHSVLDWMEDKSGLIKGHMDHVRFASVSAQVSDLAARFPEAVLEGLLAVNDGLSKSARRDLLERLSYPS